MAGDKITRLDNNYSEERNGSVLTKTVEGAVGRLANEEKTIGNEGVVEITNELKQEIEEYKEIEETLKEIIKFTDRNNNAEKYCLLTKRFGCSVKPKRKQNNKNAISFVPFYFCMHEHFLLQRLVQLFPVTSLYKFLQSMQTRGPLMIRTNTLKTKTSELGNSFMKRKIRFDTGNLDWSCDTLVVHSKKLRKGATPEYLSGHYIIQDLSGVLPVLALDPKVNEKILDVCSGDGRKASHIAAMMQNTGALFANEINNSRLKPLRINFLRLGVTNSIVTNLNGEEYPNFFKDFDRVLVDAPSSGTGVISKEPIFRVKLNEMEIERFAAIQKKLLLAAIDSVKAGGIIVYSTSSILPEENEHVIEFTLRKRKVKLVETGLAVGTNGLTEYMGRYMSSSMTLTRRFYPHSDSMDGSFVAKLQKL